MLRIDNYTVCESDSLLDVLTKINNQPESSMTVFVLDDNRHVIGTVTDGDIRRAVLKLGSLDISLAQIMQREFRYLSHTNYDVNQIQEFKRLKIRLVPVLDDQMKIVKILNLETTKSILPIDAVLMAGGKGERLRPATLTTPKPLLKVGDKPIIDYNVENLLQNGIEHINVTINYLAEQIEAHFAPPRQNGVQVLCVREPKYLGTMGSIKFVGQWYNDTILVMNSDLFTNIDLEDFYLYFKEYDADMCVAAVPYTVNVPYGIFEIENRQNIIGVKEKPTYHYYANAGIYLLKRSVLDLIPHDEFFNATDLIELLVSKSKNVIRFPLSGYWIDIGKPEDFNKVQDFAKHINKL